MPHEEAQRGKTVPPETMERNVMEAVFERFQEAIELSDIKTLTKMAQMLTVEMDRRLKDEWNLKMQTQK